MVDYHCDICKYDSNKKCNFEKHCRTKKHIEKVNNKGKRGRKKAKPIPHCKICDKYFGRTDSLTRHNSSQHPKKEEPIQLDDKNILPMNLAFMIQKSITDVLSNLNIKNTDTALNKSTNISKATAKSSVGQRRLQCMYCNMEFTKNSNKSRHERLCAAKQIEQYKVNYELEKYKVENETLKNDIQRILDDREKIVQLAASNTKITSKAMSAMSYVMYNYTDTPALEQITEPQVKEIVFKEETEKYPIEEIILMHYRDKDLVHYIGDGIIDLYKKDNPSEQPVWTSDVSRLNYIIREVATGEKSTWIIDKKGITVGKRIIVPLLEKIYDLLKDYPKDDQFFKYTQFGQYSNKISQVFGVLKLVETKRLERDVSAYIAPFFSIKEN
jgi:hypothetical protein